MTKQKRIGDLGEALAMQHLLSQGYRILETNWRFSRAEIDIIARLNDMLIFVEVKTRSYDYFGPPEAFVDDKKEILMADAAYRYMELIEHESEIRFDIISVLLRERSEPEIKHFKDAFFPGLE